jgi:hypothetical protein
MVEVTVDASAIVKWGRYLNEIPKATQRATARALNAYGAGVLNATVHDIANRNNWDPEQVRAHIRVSERRLRVWNGIWTLRKWPPIPARLGSARGWNAIRMLSIRIR